jgi:hypothetical protein
MTQIDPEQERARLAARYAAMSDLELQAVGKDLKSLTEWARQALQEEIKHRKMEIPFQPELPNHEGKLVVLNTYGERIRAVVDQSVLEAAGIESFLANDNAASMGGVFIWNPAMTWQLMVRASEAETAQQLLNEAKTIDGRAVQDTEGAMEPPSTSENQS